MASEQRQSCSGLEVQWRTRVRNAFASYRHASDHYKQMVQELRQNPCKERYAVSTASRAEAWARAELERTVCIYAALVIDGKTPPPDDEQMLF